MKAIVDTMILGMPLVAWGGVVTLAVLVIQILIGKKIIKVDFRYHNYTAWVLLLFALIHAVAALIYIFG